MENERMIRGNLTTEASESVENVLVFVSDSLRYDHLPEAVRATGVAGRAIATSTFTASGYSSILTGTYPSNHRVWNFEHALPKSPKLLTHYDRSGIDATRVWRNVEDPPKKPPLSIPGVTTETTLDDLDTPFVLVVHDKGGHMIYGRHEEADRWSSHSEFFDDFEGSEDEIKRRYRESVAESFEYFQTLMENLKSRNELENTLVVFTSDHGELLGEYGGLYTHGVPLVPELVGVPMVFAGAGLPGGKELDGVLSTADVAPTALGALGGNPGPTDGLDLWHETVPVDRVARSEVWKHTSYPLVRYKGSSVWTANGGHVRHLDGFPIRLLHLLSVQFYYTSHANMVRRPSRGLLSLSRSYLKHSVNYGDPPARSLIDKHLVTDFSRGQPGAGRAKPDKQQLRELGYLE